jgi:hypothetical protein
MYPQRANNLQLTADEMGGKDPVLNQNDLEDNILIPIQEIPEEGSISEHREGDGVENENEAEYDEDVAQSDTEKEVPSKDDEESQHTDVSENEPEDTHNEQLYRTRYGRAVQQYVPFTPMAATADISTMISEINVMATELNLLKSQNDEEQNFEFSLVGATGQGFENTSELRVMTYKEAIREPDAAEWQIRK